MKPTRRQFLAGSAAGATAMVAAPAAAAIHLSVDTNDMFHPPEELAFAAWSTIKTTSRRIVKTFSQEDSLCFYLPTLSVSGKFRTTMRDSGIYFGGCKVDGVDGEVTAEHVAHTYSLLATGFADDYSELADRDAIVDNLHSASVLAHKQESIPVSRLNHIVDVDRKRKLADLREFMRDDGFAAELRNRQKRQRQALRDEWRAVRM